MAVPWAVIAAAGMWLADKFMQGEASGSGAIDDASQAMAAGMDQARGQINESTRQAMGMLTPFMESGKLDYDAFRNMVYGGHFDQQAPVSYTPPQFQAQGFRMTPGAQSWGFSPYQSQAMGPISPIPLPGMPARPTPPPAPAQPPMTRAPLPQIGVDRSGMQQGMDAVKSNTLGLGQTLPNKNQTPPPGKTAVTPRAAQWSPTWAPLTLKQVMEMYGIGRPGSGPFIPGGVR